MTTQKKGSRGKKEKKNVTMRYSCTCGNHYLSKPAVYTHIKTKHNNDKVNFRIIDSTKGELENNRAFRLEYIRYPEDESKLMTLADVTFVKISQALKEAQVKMDKYLLQDDQLSDSEHEANIHGQISEKIEQYINKFQLKDNFKAVQQNYKRQLATFKIQKFNLNIRTELSKFFKIGFAWRVQTQVLLHFAKMLDRNEKIEACQAELWKYSERNIQDIVENYCKEWKSIRN